MFNPGLAASAAVAIPPAPLRTRSAHNARWTLKPAAPSWAGAGFVAVAEGRPQISKATRQDADACSAFAGTDWHGPLQRLGVRCLFVGGFASDYCVLDTVQDALHLAYGVVLLQDCSRAVDVQPGDGERAIAAMAAAGAVALKG